MGAWASAQSETLESRDTLERKFREYTEQFGEGEVPRPPHWSGYRLNPGIIEFWERMPHRLHDRLRYTLQEGGDWLMERLSP